MVVNSETFNKSWICFRKYEDVEKFRI